MKWLYRLPQKKKLRGVMIGDMAVVMAVKETDNAMLPFESAERKFDMFPPGHDAMHFPANEENSFYKRIISQ